MIDEFFKAHSGGGGGGVKKMEDKARSFVKLVVSRWSVAKNERLGRDQDIVN